MKRILLTIIALLFATQSQAAILVMSQNGTYTTATSLSSAATRADVAGKTVHVTSALSSSFSNISSATVHAWPSDRKLVVDKGGSINPTTKFVFVSNEVTPEMFGAAGNGTTDDTAAVQKAVNACMYDELRPVPLTVSGKYLLTASVNINQSTPVTTLKLQDFRIIGKGSGAGFYIAGNVVMFSATAAHTTQSVTNRVSFENVVFEADVNTRDGFVIDNAFIQIKFTECQFNKIRCMDSVASNTFSYYFHKCIMMDWADEFFQMTPAIATPSLNDIKFTECYASGGRHLVVLGGLTQEFVFLNNTVEACTGVPVSISGAYGMLIAGNYFEANALAGDLYYLNLVNGGLPPTGTVTGNEFFITAGQVAEPTFYPINATGGTGLFIAGNWTNGPQLFLDNVATPGGVIATANVISITVPLRSGLYGEALTLMSDSGAGNQKIYQVKTVAVTKTYNSDLFNAAATTDSAVIWTQPANSLLIGFRALQTTQFVATSMTDLDVAVGDSGDQDGIFGEAMNLTSAPSGNPFLNRGVYWSGGAAGTEYYTSTAKDWYGYSTATGANLSTLSAGSITFYFIYRLL